MAEIKIKCSPILNNNEKISKFKEVSRAVCALLNHSNGGRVVLLIEDQEGSAGKGFKTKLMRTFLRGIEQRLKEAFGDIVYCRLINIEHSGNKVEILVEPGKSIGISFFTVETNLYSPGHEELHKVSSLKLLQSILCGIVIWPTVSIRTHIKCFVKDTDSGFIECRKVQFKSLKSDSSKRTTLADRITGKSNKFSCYVSAFANYGGGHIYYGINDDGVVEGEFIPSDKDKNEITKKVEKIINKMIWPEQICQPKRGKHWEIFFEPVVDENSSAVPSTFVIVIYIAACLGGVFTDEPECYEMVEGKVKKMSFATWREKILPPVWLQRKEEIPHSVGRITWSSVENRKAYTFADQALMHLVNNGNWNAISKISKCLENKYPQLPEIKLLVLSKRITARYRRGHFNKAQALLQEYTDILPQARDLRIFEVLRLYLNAALKRAIGDFVGLKEFLFAALSKAEFIEPGLVPAIVYIFAATVTDLVNSEDQTETFSPQQLSIKALQYLECVPDPSYVLADMKQKSHITLATFYLGCNISGQRIKYHGEVSLDEAKKSIMAVHQSIYEENALSGYRELQLNLVQSIYYYRYSQDAPNQRARYLGDAFNYAKKAESLANGYQFTEMAEWSGTHKAMCTEELLSRHSRRELTQ